MTAALSADGVFSTHRNYPFCAADIFAAFADPARLAQWWGPNGFRNTFEVFEFAPQGRWKFVMHGPDGRDYANEARFIETSPHCIVIRHCCAPDFTLRITLTETAGHTRLDWHQAFDDPQVAAAVAAIVLPANEQNLDRLQTALAAATR
jgi:uncharacterized protein YndB with AHSA1/START domain